jgi:hypothetical protein
MKPKWNVQFVAALRAVGTVSVPLAAIDFLAHHAGGVRDDALARQMAPVRATLPHGPRV